MSWRRGTLADFMGDRVVYRNLEPVDDQIDGLSAVWEQVGLDHYYVPRKTSEAYAAAMMAFVAQAQQARGIAQPIARILFVGDTLMNDGTAARNVGAYLPMMGFIGADRTAQPAVKRIEDRLLIANRWSMLHDYRSWVQESAFACDEQTVMLIDLDKTSLGARGRNDHVIDTARLAAVERTMVGALGETFDRAAFKVLYDRLNQPDYHYFTADNQDYLAYICLMVSGGVYAPSELWADLSSGAIDGIATFVSLCDGRRDRMSAGLSQAQDEVCRGIAAEDPTPFKGFRRGEYFETVAQMDRLPDDAPYQAVLAHEIVITGEVADLAGEMAAQGVLVFGISDKPDEASIPQPEDAARGMQPIHRTPMKIYSA